MPVVEAAAAFTSTRSDLAKRIETAMSGAALMASAEGITDPDEVRDLMLAARARVKDAAGED